MKIVLTQAEKREFLVSVFANGGLSELLHGGDSTFDYDGNDYRRRKRTGDCYEDVLARMVLNGDEILLDGKKIDMANFKLIPVELVVKVQAGEDDAWTGYEILQWLAFGEVVYG